MKLPTSHNLDADVGVHLNLNFDNFIERDFLEEDWLVLEALFGRNLSLKLRELYL